MVSRIITGLLVFIVFLPTLVAADTYRWRDKEGNLHFGESVPAEYAGLPYDVVNDAGLVIKHVEKGDVPPDVVMKEEKKSEGRAPLISVEERRRQADRYLLLQYKSEEDIQHELEMELSQMAYDLRINQQSMDSTKAAIRSQLRDLADQQRAGQVISDEQRQEVDKLYARLSSDKRKLARLDQQGETIRTRFQTNLERFRYLTSQNETQEETQAEQD